jgi:uncharacterized DUF497 family protein
VEFEFDPEKNQINQAKHRIDFEEAKELWNDPNAIETPSDIQVSNESPESEKSARNFGRRYSLIAHQ